MKYILSLILKCLGFWIALNSLIFSRSCDFLGLEVGFKEVCFTTRPDVMELAYNLYKRMGFEEKGCDKGVVSMKMDL